MDVVADVVVGGIGQQGVVQGPDASHEPQLIPKEQKQSSSSAFIYSQMYSIEKLTKKCCCLHRIVQHAVATNFRMHSLCSIILCMDAF